MAVFAVSHASTDVGSILSPSLIALEARLIIAANTSLIAASTHSAGDDGDAGVPAGSAVGCIGAGLAVLGGVAGCASGGTEEAVVT